MKQYKNLQGNSGVDSYQLGEDSITVRFINGGTYLYTNESTGTTHIKEMQRLAQLGKGLNSYISKVIKKQFARKVT